MVVWAVALVVAMMMITVDVRQWVRLVRRDGWISFRFNFPHLYSLPFRA